MSPDKYSILIQGPLDNISLNNLANYQNYCEVIVSCWNDVYSDTWANSEEVEKFLNTLDINYSFEKTPDITKTIGCNKKSTFYYALNSMYNGLKLVESEYVIKTRSDEYYKNLKPFIDEFEKDDNKIVCGNIFARRDMPWHIGDHIIICKTVDLLKAVENLINHYNNKFQSLEKYMVQRKQNTAELILCLAILQQKDAKIDYLDYSDYKDEFLNYISIVDINKAEEFVAQWKHGNKKYINLFINHHHVKDSDDY